MDSEFPSSFVDNDVTNKKVVRRTQSTKCSVCPKENISRRHSSNASAGKSMHGIQYIIWLSLFSAHGAR